MAGTWGWKRRDTSENSAGILNPSDASPNFRAGKKSQLVTLIC